MTAYKNWAMKQRDGNSKKEPKRYARNHQHCKQGINAIGLLVDWTWLREKIFELEDISIETSKTEKQRQQRLKKVSKIVGLLQKCNMYSGNTRQKKERMDKKKLKQ